jgi:hypothetical protein
MNEIKKEHEYWTICAEYWDKARLDVDGVAVVLIDRWYSSCLCYSINLIVNNMDMVLQMHKKIIDFAPHRQDSGFCWPRDLDGARSRAAFCCQMAEETKYD